MKADVYMATLNEVLFKLEDLYGMHYELDGNRISNAPIKDVIKYFNEKVISLDETQKIKLNRESGRILMPLSYVSDRMRFYSKKRLDYSKYANMRTIAKVLITFTNIRNINIKALKSINKIIELLVYIDEKNIAFRNGLAYRYLRMFVICVLFSNYANASIIANFILHQFIIKEELR